LCAKETPFRRTSFCRLLRNLAAGISAPNSICNDTAQPTLAIAGTPGVRIDR
jgi:hypothetical protein